MNENQEKLIAFIEKYFSEKDMRSLSQLIHGDEEYFKGVQEELIFLVEEHTKFIDNINLVEVIFNKNLVKRQKVDEAGLANLALLNILKELVNKSIMDYDKFAPDELQIMRNLGKLIYPMEVVAQRLWKFDSDDTKHTWWYQLDACECPVLDNQDMFGVDRAYINMSCPIHGDLDKILQKKEVDENPITEEDIELAEQGMSENLINAHMDAYEILLTDGRILDMDEVIDSHGASGFGYMLEGCEKNISIREFLKKYATFIEITTQQDAYLIANRGEGIFTSDESLWCTSSYINEKSQLRSQWAGNYDNGQEIPAFGNFQFILRKKK